MALDSKVNIQADIAARQIQIPSGVFMDGVERPGTFTRPVIAKEVYDLCDAILSFISGTDEVMTAVTAARTTIANSRKNLVDRTLSVDGVETDYITDESGAQRPCAVLDRGVQFENNLMGIILNTANIMDGAYGATSAVTLAMALLDDAVAQSGAGVILNDHEAGGVTRLHEFRRRYLIVLASVAGAFP